MREPHFWSANLDPHSREAAPLTRFLLTPFSALYAYITSRRIARTKSATVDIPVICIGNLTAGGTGKSPVVAYIRAKIEKTMKRRAASLSRGYGGQLKGPLKVDQANHTARDVGDEPLMLSASGESWIGADRVAAAKAMLADGVGAIIMDDGHQNPGLAKDLSLIVVDGEAQFGNGFVIPKGPLREPIEEGLSRADAVILIGDGTLPEPLTNFTKPILRARITPRGQPASKPYVAFAGIGRPEKFFDSLKAVGAELCDAVPFSDHHVFTNRDLNYLHSLAADHGAKLITTEKDYARLDPEDRKGILTFPITVQFETPEVLDNLLIDVIKAEPE